MHLAPAPVIQASRKRRVIKRVARRDPTQTTGIRKAWEADVNRRFAKVAREVMIEIPGLLEAEIIEIKVNRDDQDRFFFKRSPNLEAGFMRWLDSLVGVVILEVPTGEKPRKRWSDTYIDTAYQRGIRSASANLRRGGARVEDSWVSGAFNRPVHADAVASIYTRTFDALEKVTRAMAVQMRDVLATGMAEGRNPLDIARQMTDRVKKVGINRARMIARTETVAAHADATLNAYEEAGVVGVEVEAEWSTAGDDRVCEECAALEGEVFELSEARGMIPRHPGCRCVHLPVIIAPDGIVLHWRQTRKPWSNIKRPHSCKSHALG